MRPGEVTVLTGCAWPTVSVLRAAREAAGLELWPGEALIATRDMSDVVLASGQIRVLPPLPARGPADPLLDPDSDQPDARFSDLGRVPTTASGHRLIHDDVGRLLLAPDHQAVPIPASDHAAARSLPTAALRTLIGHRRPDLLPDPASAADTAVAGGLLAAVATAHFADDLRSLLAAPPSPPRGPSPPGL